MGAPELEVLMRKTAEGDQQAFRRLTLALGQRMYRQARGFFAKQPTLAEDAVQEALIKLWRTAPRWQPTGSVEGYAMRLVYTSCIDIQRRLRPSAELHEDMPANENIEAELAAHEERQILDAALEQLPEKQRRAMREFYYEGEDQRAIATKLGTTPKAVERMLARARLTMQKLLQPSLKREESGKGKEVTRHDQR